MPEYQPVPGRPARQRRGTKCARAFQNCRNPERSLLVEPSGNDLDASRRHASPDVWRDRQTCGRVSFARRTRRAISSQPPRRLHRISWCMTRTIPTLARRGCSAAPIAPRVFAADVIRGNRGPTTRRGRRVVYAVFCPSGSTGRPSRCGCRRCGIGMAIEFCGQGNWLGGMRLPKGRHLAEARRVGAGAGAGHGRALAGE